MDKMKARKMVTRASLCEFCTYFVRGVSWSFFVLFVVVAIQTTLLVCMWTGTDMISKRSFYNPLVALFLTLVLSLLVFSTFMASIDYSVKLFLFFNMANDIEFESDDAISIANLLNLDIGPVRDSLQEHLDFRS